MKPVGPVAPNLNAYAERWVQSITSECLGHFVVFGEAHLRHLVDGYVAYYNRLRPHQSLGNVPISGQPPPDSEPLATAEVLCEERLGGLLRHYYRKAA